MALELLLKKSSVSGKLPVASDLAFGEIGINYNSDGPFLSCVDTEGNVRRLNSVWVAPSPPPGPTVGDPWIDTSGDTEELYYYINDSDGWKPVASAGMATTTEAGLVILANETAITNGSTGKVVDAAQLKSAVSGFIVSVGATLPIQIGGTASAPVIKLKPGSPNSLLATNNAGDGTEFTTTIQGGSF